MISSITPITTPLRIIPRTDEPARLTAGRDWCEASGHVGHGGVSAVVYVAGWAICRACIDAALPPTCAGCNSEVDTICSDCSDFIASADA